MSHFEESKVFVGNLPLQTTPNEVTSLLCNIVDSLSIKEIKTILNKKQPGTFEQTLSAIVTVASSQERDDVISIYRLSHSRLVYCNSKGLKSKVYLSYCYPFKKPSEVPKKEQLIHEDLHSKNMIVQNEEAKVILKEHSTDEDLDSESMLVQNEEAKVTLKEDSGGENLDSEINMMLNELASSKGEKMDLVNSIQDLENALKTKSPALFISLFDLVNLQEEYTSLKNILERKKEECQLKMDERKELMALMEELNV